jgi:hypothetical protein
MPGWICGIPIKDGILAIMKDRGMRAANATVKNDGMSSLEDLVR